MKTIKQQMKKQKKHLRLIIQVLFTALTNGYVLGFSKGKIYRGASKRICVPGLNCYSCPGAIGSCPIGSLQAVLNSKNYKFSFYVIGFLMIFGSLLGRFVCGWLCPFGLVQDLLHKLPFRKIKKVPFDRQLRFLKYIILVVFVIAMPLLVVGKSGYGSPWFCKLICPSGTLLGGIPLVAKNPGLQRTIGFLFGWKISILLFIVVLSTLLYRPFCKYFCPLGAIYGIFNRFSLYHYEIDATKCTKCGLCEKSCQMGVHVCENPNSAECIRCGACKEVCPKGAIRCSIHK